MSKIVQSPLFRSGKTNHLYNIPKNDIIKAYIKRFGIDVSYLFEGVSSIAVYECLETQYKFYYPFSVAGDSKFYEHFQKFDWYYMPWKWEHQITTEYLNDGMNVLEVGCAHGAFLEKINEKFNLGEVIGLELNETTSIENSKFKIINQLVQDYQSVNKEKFDIVCSFEVLEHIADVYSFIEAQVNCLKIGGKLIISVPNNESFVRKSEFGLNYPPHHMGIWDTISLKKLDAIFPIKVKKIHYEELQQYHVNTYVKSEYYSKYGTFTNKVLRKIDQITGKLKKVTALVEEKKAEIKGHTILVVYEKI